MAKKTVEELKKSNVAEFICQQCKKLYDEPGYCIDCRLALKKKAQ